MPRRGPVCAACPRRCRRSTKCSIGVVDLYGFVSVDTNRYSVPERLVGRMVTVSKHYERVQIHYRATVVADHERGDRRTRCAQDFARASHHSSAPHGSGRWLWAEHCCA